MGDLENTLKLLTNYVESFKKESAQNRHRCLHGLPGQVLNGQGVATQRLPGGQVQPGLGMLGAAALPGPGQEAVGKSSFSSIVGQGQNPQHSAGQGAEGQTQQGRQTGRGQLGGQGRGRGASPSPKGSRNELEGAGEQDRQHHVGQEPYQPVRRRRKPNFGKNYVTVSGAEAAPIEICIGNTNPLVTEELIK